MNVIITPDPKLPSVSTEELLKKVAVVYVNDFTEESVREFYGSMIKAQSSDQPVIPIVIDSYGGQVDALTSMIDIVRSMKKPVATIVLGKAMSCGAILFSCGTQGYRFIGPNARLMIHDVSSFAFGKTSEVASRAEEQKRIQKWATDTLDTNCGKQTGYFEGLIKEKDRADWFLTPEECVQHGLANKIGVPSMEYKVKYEIKFIS